MKKFNIIMIVALCIFMLFGCKSVNTNMQKDKINIVTTIFPEYDWVKQIAGDKANIELLIDSGVDLHNYQPTANDILKIKNADLFIYVGGESDEWVEDVLETADNKDLKVINLLDVLNENVVEEETKEGMQEEEEESEEIEYDEHVWLSIKNAQIIVKKINESLIDIDGKNKDFYEENTIKYLDKLNILDSKYEDVVKGANCNVLLFADRFPFRYMVKDYNLDYYAAFVGCSAETEASFETISFLAEKVDEFGLNYIYKIEGMDTKIAETISKTSNNKPEIITVNSMQSITMQDIDEGANYIDIMEDNLDGFEKGLINE